MENVKNLRVCDKHHASLTYRGHRPAEGKSSSKSRSDAQRGILKDTWTRLYYVDVHAMAPSTGKMLTI